MPEKDVIMAKSNDYLFTSESVSEGHPDKVSDPSRGRNPLQYVPCGSRG